MTMLRCLSVLAVVLPVLHAFVPAGPALPARLVSPSPAVACAAAAWNNWQDSSRSATCGLGLRSPLALRPRREGVAMMAKAKKGKEKDAGGGKKANKQAPGAVPAGEKAPKMKKENTDVTGTDPKEIIENVKDKMSKTVENTREALGAIRTGRPSPKMFDKLMVSVYGQDSPLPQVCTVNVRSASTVELSPFDPSTLGDIEKAILTADMNLTPNNDGALIRINIPSLTTETRAQFSAQAKGVAEDGKVALRNIRRTGVEAVKKLEKGQTPISEDESKSLQDEVQKLTDKCSKELDDLFKAKDKELNTV